MVLATVLDTRGAVPRHRGAQMLITSTQTWFSVGGGRLEARVLEDARTLLARGGKRTLIDIDLTGRAGALGICGGSMRVALRCWQGDSDTRRARQLLHSLQAGDAVTLTAADIGTKVEYRVEPDPRLLIIGAGHCGLALYRAAAALDYDLCIYDSRAEGIAAADFPLARILPDLPALMDCLNTRRRKQVVLLNRDYGADIAALMMLINHDIEFIGMMGSRKRIETVFAGLPEGFEGLRQRVTAPVGIEISAETPEEIAISILAQLIAQARTT